MTAREMLESFEELRKKAESLAFEAEALRLRAGKGGADLARGRLARVQEERRRAQRLLARRQKQLAYLTGLLPSLAERQVLSLRYFEQMTYEDIGEALYFSPRHIYRLHISAVKHLDEVME